MNHQLALFTIVLAAATAQEPRVLRPPDVLNQPTPIAIVREMLNMAGVGRDDIVYDLGSGDGRIVITAAVERGAHGVGIDIDPVAVWEGRERAKDAGVSDRVEFRNEDLFEVDFRQATVVTLYLLPALNLKLRPKLLAQLKPGARIVSHAWNMGDWLPDRVLEVGGSRLYLWTIRESR
jgi:hypothetical protein